MYVFHTNQIWDSIKDQSNCGLYMWIVFMNICFRIDSFGPCWSEASIKLDFYVALGEN